VSLARTAWWLATTAAQPDQGSAPGEDKGGFLVEIPAGGHTIAAVAPPGTIAGQPLRWPHAGHGYGGDPPAWTLPATGST
jgi:hypothetical protein